MRYFSLCLIVFYFLLSGCKNSTSENLKLNVPGIESDSKMQYAEKFSLRRIGKNYLLRVYSPWQNASNTSFEYIVGPDINEVPDSLRAIPFIQNPVRNAVIMSTTFISFIDTLGELASVCGVSGGKYTYNKQLRNSLQAGTVRDVGYDHSLNYEVIVELKPDVVFIFGVQAGIVQTISKLKEMGIAVVLCADYLESHPLGRTEWIKFFSVFYDKEEEATSIFNSIEENYTSLAGLFSKKNRRPTVMLGLPWKDAWYVAGGSSFAARLISDAGGEYIYKDLEITEAIPIDIEAVFSRGIDADFWINPGVATSLEMILEHDQRFELLNSFQRKNIYSNSKMTGPGGGNDYWESGIIHPDLILEDLVKIFYDSIVYDKELNYYFRLD